MPRHSWVKGQSGNPSGKGGEAGRPPNHLSLTYALREFGNLVKPGKENKKVMRDELVKSMWEKAIDGDAQLAKYIFDRLEGPVKQVIENWNETRGTELEALNFISSDLISTKQFVHPWYSPAFYHREIADAIQDENELNLIIVVPPQHGKSEIVTKTFPAYYIANNPENTIVLGTYNNEYANELSVKSRDFFIAEKFKWLFPGIELHPEQQTKHKWAIRGHEGSAIFAGVGGTITGNPADVFLVDDIDKDFEDACSKVQQEKKWNWFNYVADSRMRGERSRKIIVTTRWVKNDLVGRILRQEEENNTPPEKRFKVIHYSAIMDYEGDDYSTGHPLWPAVKSMDFLLDKQKKDPAMFKAIWLGNPKNLEGQVIKPEWIKIENDIKSLGTRILSCRGWDFGYTESGDWTVGARVDIYEKGELVTPILGDVVMCRRDPTAVKEFVVETAIKDGSDVIVGLETGGTQKAMSSDISKRKELQDFSARTVEPKGDKIARAMPWILKIEDGHFRLAKGKWNPDVINSMIDFEDGCDHDDIEDAITVAWKILFGVAS